MGRPPLFSVLILAALLAFPGCAMMHRKKKPVPRAVPVPQPLLVGKIALVNEAGHFVLVDNGTLPAPPSGVTLKTFTGAVQSGELESGEVRRPPFLIADIRAGAPKKGDRVYFRQTEAVPRAEPVRPVVPAEPVVRPSKKNIVEPTGHPAAPTFDLKLPPQVSGGGVVPVDQ
jgi:hypothetical protein